MCGHEHLLAVRERRREVDERDVRLRGSPAGGRDRIRDAGPRGEVVEAGLPDGTCDVDDQGGGCGRRARVRRSAQRWDCDVRRATMEDARRDQDDTDGDGESGGEQAAVVHAAIVAAEALRQGVGFHEGPQFGKLLSLTQEPVGGDAQGTQDLVAFQ